VKLEDLEVTAFWDMTLGSLVNIHQRFGGTYCLHLHSPSPSPFSMVHPSPQAFYSLPIPQCFFLAAYYSTLKMEVAGFSEDIILVVLGN
jgi:hypothetical protein